MILALFCSLNILGCATWKTHEVPAKLPLSSEKIREILSRFAPEPQENTLKAIARISIDYPRGTYTKKVAILVKKPSSLRIESVPIFGPSDFLMTAEKKLFKVFLPMEGSFYIGSSTVKNLSRFFLIPIPLDEIASILTGTPPIEINDTLRLTGYREGKMHRIDAALDDTPLQSIRLDQTNENLLGVEVFEKDGRIAYAASFEDFTSLGGTTYPQNIKIAVKQGPEKIYITIQYLDLVISRNDDTSLFNLTIPPGITPTFLN